MKKYFPVLLLTGAVVLSQLLTLVTGTGFLLTQLTMSAYYALVALGLCLVMGYAGQISLGQAGFFAVGGYATAWLTTLDFSGMTGSDLFNVLHSTGLLLEKKTLYGETLFHLTPWLALILAVVLSALTAYLIGTAILRLKGHYLAMATMGFGIIVNRIVLGTGIFGEADGISNVPEFNIFPGVAVSGDFTARIGNYYISWILVIAAIVLIINLINSRIGRALRSLHDGEEAADAMGVDTAKYKVKVFMIGAVLAAVAGFFMTHYNGGIGPSEAGVTKSVRYVAIVAVGGMANIWGTLIMGVLLNFLSLRGVFGHLDDAVFGVILVLMMLFMPDGFVRREFLSELKRGFKRVRTFFRRDRKQIGEEGIG